MIAGIIPFLIKPVDGLYDIGELTSLNSYCFLHADRANPLQDLIDNGFMSSNMTGITCKDVKQMSDINQNQISDLQEKINQVGIYGTDPSNCLENQHIGNFGHCVDN